MAFAIIRDSRNVGDGEVQGRLDSNHRKASAAFRTLNSRQRACKLANGSSSYLPLSVIEVTWSEGCEARGTLVDEYDC